MSCRPLFRTARSSAIVAALWLAACSSDDTSSQTNPAQSGCMEGKVQSCSCADVSSGTQSCGDGGWSACVCGAKDAGPRSMLDADLGTNSSALSVPCDVQTILQQKCSSCHGSTPDFAAPMSIVSYADLMAPAPKTPGKKVYEQLGVRIHDERLPMPPVSAPELKLTAPELATFDAWIKGGARASTDKCAAPAVSLPDAGPRAPTDKWSDLKGPTDCEQTYEFRAHDPADKIKPYTVSAGTNLDGTPDKYICFYFKPPYTDGSHGLWFASMLDQTKILHHWLLYGTDLAAHADGDVAPCSAAEPGAYVLAGWAPGANDVVMPAGIGLHMPSGPTSGLILEIHYWNGDGKPIQDQTGMRLCTAKANTRPHTAAVHFTGTESICIPPGASEYTTTGHCQPRTDQGDIHIIGVWPHMHKHGRRMKITFKRAGSGLVEVLNDQPFDFNNQIKYPKEDVVLHPGDTMDTTCYFDNDTTWPIPFGEKTSTEMCFGFITAWPAGALSVDPFSLNPIQNIGLGIQPARRCLDPVGIFGSCNGLGDYPL